MKARRHTLVAGAMLCCAVGLVTPAASAATLTAADRDFLVSTAQGATYELAVAKLALTKATRSDIRRYARTMIADHESLNPKLHRLAQQNGVDLPTTMTDEKQRSYDHLESLDGKAFDTAFVQAEAQDNQNDVATEQKELDSTDNPSVKRFVLQLKQSDTKHATLGRALQQAGR